MSNSEQKPRNFVEDFLFDWKLLPGESNENLVPKNEKLMNYLKNEGFFTAPASTKYHGCHEGGLFEHSEAVFRRLLWLTNTLGLKWQRPESPFIVGMFHDLCKCDQYIRIPGEFADSEPRYEYNEKTLLKGHGEKSVMILSQFITLTEEEMLCIRYHMGAYIKEDLDGFDLAIRTCENTYYSHVADMLASKIDGV